MSDHVFKVGDVVQYTGFGKKDWKIKHHSCIGIIKAIREDTQHVDVAWISQNFSKSDVEGDYETGWAIEGLCHFHDLNITETSDVPPSQNPLPVSTASPALGKRTSSARGSRSRP